MLCVSFLVYFLFFVVLRNRRRIRSASATMHTTNVRIRETVHGTARRVRIPILNFTHYFKKVVGVTLLLASPKRILFDFNPFYRWLPAEFIFLNENIGEKIFCLETIYESYHLFNLVSSLKKFLSNFSFSM